MLDTPLTRADQEFLDGVRRKLVRLLESEEEMLELEPMNSYQRRLVHKLATTYGFKSQSVGETERFVCVIKTQESAIPQQDMNPAPGQIYDMGDQIFYAVPQTRVVLRADGSVGVVWKDNTLPNLDERVLPTGEFRIRKNQIVCPGDPNW